MSVRLRTKWLWVRVPLQSPKIIISFEVFDTYISKNYKRFKIASPSCTVKENWSYQTLWRMRSKLKLEMGERTFPRKTDKNLRFNWFAHSVNHTAQKNEVFQEDFFSKFDQIAVTFTEEVLNGKRHVLYSARFVGTVCFWILEIFIM